MKLKSILVLAIALATTAGAADRSLTRTEKMAQRREFVTHFAGPAVNSVPFRGNYDFEPLGTHTLLLYESLNRAYLLEIEDFCPNLPSAFSIAVDNKSSTLSTRFNNVIVSGRSCQIRQIRPVDVRAMKAAQRAEREAVRVTRRGS